MSDLNLSLTADSGFDDLPLTVLRERNARAREAREREALGDTPRCLRGESSYRRARTCADEPVPAAVTRFDVPFVRLMTFFLKAVVAAIPAFVLLATLLWFGGRLLESQFPELVKMKILISFPNG